MLQKGYNKHKEAWQTSQSMCIPFKESVCLYERSDLSYLKS